MYVYVLKRPHSNKIKVGKSDNIESRIKTYRTEDPELTILILDVMTDIERDVIDLFDHLSSWTSSECISLKDKYKDMSVMQLWTEAMNSCESSIFKHIDAAINHHNCSVLEWSFGNGISCAKRHLTYERMRRTIDDSDFDPLHKPAHIDDYFRHNASTIIESMIVRLKDCPRYLITADPSLEGLRQYLGDNCTLDDLLLAAEVLMHRHSLGYILPLEKIGHLIDQQLLYFVFYFRSLQGSAAQALEYVVKSLKHLDFDVMCDHVRSLEKYIRKDFYIRDSDNLTCDTYDIVRYALGMYTIKDIIMKTIIPQSTVRRHLISHHTGNFTTVSHIFGIPTYSLPPELEECAGTLKLIRGPCKIVKVLATSRGTSGKQLIEEDQLMIETDSHIDITDRTIYRKCNGNDYQLTPIVGHHIRRRHGELKIVGIYKNRINMTSAISDSSINFNRITVLTHEYVLIDNIIFCIH